MSKGCCICGGGASGTFSGGKGKVVTTDLDEEDASDDDEEGLACSAKGCWDDGDAETFWLSIWRSTGPGWSEEEFGPGAWTVMGRQRRGGSKDIGIRRGRERKLRRRVRYSRGRIKYDMGLNNPQQVWAVLTRTEVMERVGRPQNSAVGHPNA